MNKYKSFLEAKWDEYPYTKKNKTYRSASRPKDLDKHLDHKRSKDELAKKARPRATMKKLGYKWDKDKMQYEGRRSYMDTNPGLEEAIWEILIKFQNQNIDKGMTVWRFKNSEVVDELDTHPVYGTNGSNPWPADDKSKEKVISKIRQEWGIVDPHRQTSSSKGTTQVHKTGYKQAPLLKPEQ